MTLCNSTGPLISPSRSHTPIGRAVVPVGRSRRFELLGVGYRVWRLGLSLLPYSIIYRKTAAAMASAQLIETSEEDSSQAVARYIGDLLNDGEVRPGGIWERGPGPR